MTVEGAQIGTAHTADDAGRRLSLRRLPVAWLDRMFPERAGPFVAVVAAISVVCWLAGRALATDGARFLASHEWQAQPLYMAVHLVVVRLFVTAYAGGFLGGCSALVIAPADAERLARRVLGPIGFCVALAVAAPLAAYDFTFLLGGRYVSESAATLGSIDGADWLLVSMWTVEWIANAYVWVVIAGFLMVLMRVLDERPFRDPVIQVLRERQYRPFLMMSSRGASIVLAFTAASGLYVLYTKGEASDYIGLWITAGLLLAAFVPPWVKLRSRISTLVRAETDRLGRSVEAAMDAAAGARPDAPPARTLEELGDRIQAALAYLRIGHLERLHVEMGRTEAQAVLLRLLAPIATMAWKLVRGG